MPTEINKSRAVFFDKDGTLIEDVPYNVRPDLIVLKQGAAQIVQNLKKAGFKLFVVSNQSGVARGFFEEKDLEAVRARIEELCAVEFDGFYFCPHFAEGKVEKYSFACDCRKPAAGMILRAAREHRIDLKSSWVIGDSPKDAEAGRRAGCRTILLASEKISGEKADFRVESLTEAWQIILENL